MRIRSCRLVLLLIESTVEIGVLLVERFLVAPNRSLRMQPRELLFLLVQSFGGHFHFLSIWLIRNLLDRFFSLFIFLIARGCSLVHVFVGFVDARDLLILKKLVNSRVIVRVLIGLILFLIHLIQGAFVCFLHSLSLILHATVHALRLRILQICAAAFLAETGALITLNIAGDFILQVLCWLLMNIIVQVHLIVVVIDHRFRIRVFLRIERGVHGATAASHIIGRLQVKQIFRRQRIERCLMQRDRPSVSNMQK